MSNNAAKKHPHSDWQNVKISDAYRFTKKPRDLKPTDSTIIPFIPMDLVPQGGNTKTRFIEKTIGEITSGTYFERGDILLSKITPSFENGKQGIADEIITAYGYASTEVIPIHEIEGQSSRHFLFYYLLDPEVRHQIAERMEGSTGRQRVPEPLIKEWLIPFPPLQEQKKISAILWKIQQAIEVETDLIRVSRELKAAVMKKLFTEGLNGEPQKETEIGLVPESWEVGILGDLIEVVSKGSSPKWQGFQYTDSGVLFVRSQNVGNGTMRWDEKVFLSPSFNVKEPRSILKEGDVLLNLVGASIGRVSLGDQNIEGANCNQAVCFVRVNQRLLIPSFLVGFLLSNSGQEQIHFNKKDIARANISLQDVKNFRVPVPSITVQHQIASVLETLIVAEEIHANKVVILTSLFNSCLAELMAGSIRVTDLDIDTACLESQGVAA